jgi:hypothetical protein
MRLSDRNELGLFGDFGSMALFMSLDLRVMLESKSVSVGKSDRLLLGPTGIRGKKRTARLGF